jgi:Lrp/AsnC family leucine-responsive transcriptional regulator
MEEAGLIKGYQAVLDLTLLGRPIEAVVRLAVRSPNDSAYVSTGLRRHPEILEARRVTGPDGWVVRISAADVETLEQTIDGLAEFGVPTTAMVLSTPVPPRHPPLRRQPSPSDH